MTPPRLQQLIEYIRDELECLIDEVRSCVGSDPEHDTPDTDHIMGTAYVVGPQTGLFVALEAIDALLPTEDHDLDARRFQEQTLADALDPPHVQCARREEREAQTTPEARALIEEIRSIARPKAKAKRERKKGRG